MRAAIEREGEGHGASLRGDPVGARVAYGRAIEAYRDSWEAAPAHAKAYGRLVGMLKASVLAGAGAEEAAYVRAAIDDDAAATSPTAAYARAVAALITGDDDEAARHAEAMGAAPAEPFGRAAAAIDALARGDGGAYREALTAIVHDFEAREAHLTGVAFADTAAMLETLAAPRGLAARPSSAVLAPLA
jgi:hypothetical protein